MKRLVKEELNEDISNKKQILELRLKLKYLCKQFEMNLNAKDIRTELLNVADIYDEE